MDRVPCATLPISILRPEVRHDPSGSHFLNRTPSEDTGTDEYARCDQEPSSWAKHCVLAKRSQVRRAPRSAARAAVSSTRGPCQLHPIVGPQPATKATMMVQRCSD